MCDWMIYWGNRWNMKHVEMRSWHSIFKKKNTVLRLLGYALIMNSFRRRYPDSTGMLGSYKWRWSDVESWKIFIWLRMKFEK